MRRFAVNAPRLAALLALALAVALLVATSASALSAGSPLPLASAARHAHHHKTSGKHKHHRNYVHRVAKKTTAMPSTSHVLSVSGDPAAQQSIVLAKGTRGPPVGGALVLGPSKQAPDGVLGVVTSRRRLHNGSLLLVTQPGTLESAYKSFHAHLDTTLGTLESGGASSADAVDSSALGHFAPSFTCHGAALPHPITTHVDLSDLHVVLDVTTQPSIEFLVTGSPRFDLGVAFGGKVTCTASAGIPIPVADTGIVLKIGPKFTFSAQGAVGADFTWTPHLSFGYIRSRYSGNTDTHVFRSEGSVKFSGSAAVDLYLALETEISLAGRVGVDGTIGPDLNGRLVADSASGSECFTVDGSVKAQLTAFADVLFKTWSFDLFSGSFGDAQLYRSCAGLPPAPKSGPTGPAPGTTLIDNHDSELSLQTALEFSHWAAATGKPVELAGDLPASLSGYRCVVLNVNEEFANSDPAALSSYLHEGGTVVALGEHEGFDIADNAINELSEALGAKMLLNDDEWDVGPFFTFAIDPSPLTANVGELGYNWASSVYYEEPAEPLVEGAEEEFTMIAAQPLQGGTFILSGDSNPFSDDDYGAYSEADNGTLVHDLCG